MISRCILLLCGRRLSECVMIDRLMSTEATVVVSERILVSS